MRDRRSLSRISFALKPLSTTFIAILVYSPTLPLSIALASVKKGLHSRYPVPVISQKAWESSTAKCMAADWLPVFLTYLAAYLSPSVVVASNTSSAPGKVSFILSITSRICSSWKYWNTPRTRIITGRDLSTSSAHRMSNRSPAIRVSLSDGGSSSFLSPMTSGRSIS